MSSKPKKKKNGHSWVWWTWDNSLFIQKFTTYSFRLLKVWPTWTGLTTSFKNSLRTALDHWKYGQRERERDVRGDNFPHHSNVTCVRIRLVHHRLFWGQQPQKRRLPPELALVGSQKNGNCYVQLYQSIVESEANVNVNGVGTWDNNSLFIQKFTT